MYPGPAKRTEQGVRAVVHEDPGQRHPGSEQSYVPGQAAVLDLAEPMVCVLKPIRDPYHGRPSNPALTWNGRDSCRIMT